MTDRQMRLYSSPESYCSQKVHIALHEKKVKYESVFLSSLSGLRDEAWFMRINPEGVIPVLQDGDKIIRESEIIIDYIDKEFPTDSKLVPDMSTEMGKEVSRWRKVLDTIDIAGITCGILCYPELSAGVKYPIFSKYSKTDIVARYQCRIKQLEQRADEHPDLRQGYRNKAAKLKKDLSKFADKENIVRILDHLQKVLDQVEEQLQKVEAEPSRELWSCGQQFTAADIVLCVLLIRIMGLGLLDQYLSDSKWPWLHAYWKEARKRPSIKRCLNDSRRHASVMQRTRTALPIVCGVVALGLAVGLAFKFAQKG